ncbi:hypothetical protein [Alcaligenes sp. CHO6]|uniref:hypothetical protein n=1 Tax=Alcaligenes sp. CHO6 TaxID=3123298 RepID=UPI0030148608
MENFFFFITASFSIMVIMVSIVASVFLKLRASRWRGFFGFLEKKDENEQGKLVGQQAGVENLVFHINYFEIDLSGKDSAQMENEVVNFRHKIKPLDLPCEGVS